ncbi:MAG: prepilin peptidase [Candidatus Thorarchaeota archaeon]|nr:prepilin peptidase [Candidatus Thorarchaeota archaeon]
MALIVTPSSALSFLAACALLTVCSVTDLRQRVVPNRIVALGAISGIILVSATGHLMSEVELHIVAILMVSPVLYLLWRIGTIGGGDLKMITVITIVSPGIELTSWSPAMAEVIMGTLLQILLMLTMAELYSRWYLRTHGGPERKGRTPLVPFLFAAYLATQLLAFL